MLILLILQSVFSQTVDYTNQGSAWTGTCATGSNQSPIDVSVSSGTCDNSMVMDLQFNNTDMTVVMQRLSYTILSNAAISNLYATDINGNLYGYTATQFSFHSPSEHQIDGNRYDLEMQIKHTVMVIFIINSNFFSSIVIIQQYHIPYCYSFHYVFQIGCGITLFRQILIQFSISYKHNNHHYNNQYNEQYYNQFNIQYNNNQYNNQYNNQHNNQHNNQYNYKQYNHKYNCKHDGKYNCFYQLYLNCINYIINNNSYQFSELIRFIIRLQSIILHLLRVLDDSKYDFNFKSLACDENVNWYIINQVLPINSTQLTAFQSYFSANSSFQSTIGNTRVLQNTNGRTIQEGGVACEEQFVYFFSFFILYIFINYFIFKLL